MFKITIIDRVSEIPIRSISRSIYVARVNCNKMFRIRQSNASLDALLVADNERFVYLTIKYRKFYFR